MQERNASVRVQPLMQSMTVKIGGLGGLGSSEAKADISLDRVSFAAGETINVNALLNNSKCKKAVKNLKVKLMRKIDCLNSGRVVWSKD